MTAKTIHKRAKSRFDAPAIRRRIKRKFKKKFGFHVGLKKINDVWNDWVEEMVISPLVKGGKVNLDKRTSLSIVGRRIIDDNSVFGLMKSGVLVDAKTGKKRKISKLNDLRRGIIYSIEVEDRSFKHGKIYFNADRKIKKAVNKALEETNTYYDIK